MCKVLYVEDDEEDMFLFDNAIYQVDKDIDIVYATCADDFYYFISSWAPDYVFLDLALPGEQGLDCLKKVRQMRFSCPIIIYTISGDQKTIEACYQAKANYFVQKPLYFDSMVSVLKKIFVINWKTDRYPDKARFVLA